MARGGYTPARMSYNKETLLKALKGAQKPKSPNKHMTTTAYKSGLKKAPESGS